MTCEHGFLWCKCPMEVPADIGYLCSMHAVQVHREWEERQLEVERLRKEAKKHENVVNFFRGSQKAANDLHDDLQREWKKSRNEVERLRDWKVHVLAVVKLIPEYESGEWAGDKEGWGFIFELLKWQVNEVERLREELDNLQWLLCHEFKEKNPDTPKPDWLTVASCLREAADAAAESEVSDDGTG